MKPFGPTRLFLLASLALFAGALGLSAAMLRPEGLVRARSPRWGPAGGPALHGIEGYGANRRGGLCGLRRVVDGGVVQETTLPDCHSYRAPSVVVVGSRALVVWERGDGEVAVSTLGPGPVVERTVLLPRPRNASGSYLPRTAVRSDAGRLAIWYRGDRVVSVSPELVPWPGGAGEVAGARLGPLALVLAFGILGLLSVYFVAAGWTLLLPRTLRRRRARGRCLELELPRTGSSAVIDGQAVELELGHARAFGGSLEELAGAPVTLVCAHPQTRGEPYRRRGGLRVAQVWAGGFAEALARARALRARTLALAIFASATLLLGVDAYLAL